MGRPTTLSGYFSSLRAVSGAVALVAAIASCSDSSTAPSGLAGRDPALAGIKVVSVQVPDAIKNPWLHVATTSSVLSPVLSAQRLMGDSKAANVVGTKLANVAGTPSTYVVSTLDFNPEPSPSHVLIAQDPQNESVPCGDCVAFHVPIGFAFTFYGNSYSELDVSSNGLVGFGSTLGTENSPRDGCCSGWGIPSDDPASMYNNIIALAWTDWTPSKDAPVTFETQGSAPNRKFVLQWNSVPEYIPGAGSVTAQLVLSEGSNDITMYTTSMNVTNMWHWVTQGIQNPDGSEAAFLPGRVQDQFVLSNDAIRFSVPLGDPPVLMAAANLSVTTDPGVCDAKLAIAAPGVVGNPPGTSVAGQRNDNLGLDAPYPKGATTITWLATDAAGVTVLETQMVNVADHEAPHITPPTDVVVPNDPGLASAYVNVGAAHVEDNCSSVTVNDPANGVYPVGVSQIAWTAVDESGNTSSATQLVTVKDVEAPTISMPSGFTVYATSPAGAAVSFASFGHDNVSVTSFACDPMSGNVFPIGNTSVSCSAVDAAGNKSAPASFVITVTRCSGPDRQSDRIHGRDSYPRAAQNRADKCRGEPAAESRDRLPGHDVVHECRAGKDTCGFLRREERADHR
jgi:hypothetical protein